VTAVTAAAAVAGIARGLYKLDVDRVPRVGVLAAVFFVASLIHVPVGVSSAHLLLSGIVGLLLGWAAFPALAAALLLQAIVFHFGGIVSLGANVVNMAVPAVAAHYLFRRGLRRSGPGRPAFALGAAAGAFAVLGSGLMMSLSLYASGREFLVPAAGVLAAHVPVMIADGFVTGAAISFVARVRPELLRQPGE
jgi:cobalt/nickel transport system permease protein